MSRLRSINTDRLSDLIHDQINTFQQYKTDEFRFVKEINDIEMRQYTPFTTNGKVIVTGDYNSFLKVYSIETGKLVKTLRIGNQIGTRTLLMHNNIIICGSYEQIYILTLDGDMKTLKGIQGWINALALSNNRLVSGSGAGHVQIWDFNTGECIRTLEGHDDYVHTITIDDNLITSHTKKEIKVWELNTGKYINSILYREFVIGAVSKNGLITSVLNDGTIKTNENVVLNQLEYSNFVNATFYNDRVILSRYWRNQYYGTDIVEVRDIKTGELIQKIPNIDAEYDKMAISNGVLVHLITTNKLRIYR